MYRHVLPAYRKLMREGRLARALVTGVRGLHTSTVGLSRWSVTLRVRFDDGREAEVVRALDSHDLGGAYADTGDILPVRYDPDDHTKVDIDCATFRAEQRAGWDEMDEASLRRGEAEFSPKPPVVAEVALTTQLRDMLIDLRRQHDAGAITEDDVETRLHELDKEFDGELRRYFEAVERGEASGDLTRD